MERCSQKPPRWHRSSPIAQRSSPFITRAAEPGIGACRAVPPTRQWRDAEHRSARGRSAANAFIRGIEGIRLAPSLGDVATTVSYPASTSHRALSPQQRAALGISDGLVRVSVGIEHIGDLRRSRYRARRRIGGLRSKRTQNTPTRYSQEDIWHTFVLLTVATSR